LQSFAVALVDLLAVEFDLDFVNVGKPVARQRFAFDRLPAALFAVEADEMVVLVIDHQPQLHALRHRLVGGDIEHRRQRRRLAPQLPRRVVTHTEHQ
jgi:hypothetical protein